MSNFTDFAKGIIFGLCIGIIIAGIVAGLAYRHRKDKELIEYVQRQQVIEDLRTDYGNRDPVDFLQTVPGVRDAADGAATEFDRKRDEALQRFRSGLPDR